MPTTSPPKSHWKDRAARHLARGLPPAEVARKVGVSRSSVYAWLAELDSAGKADRRRTA
jgi:transposase